MVAAAVIGNCGCQKTTQLTNDSLSTCTKVLIDMRPEKLNWQCDEEIKGKFAVRNIGNMVIEMDPFDLPWVYIVDADGRPPLRTAITNDEWYCGGCIISEAVRIEPGEELIRSFPFNTDINTEKALILHNGEYTITHRGLEKSHGIDSEVADVTVAIHGVSDVKWVVAPIRTTHLVEPGDTMWSIAKEYYGDGQQYTAIYMANTETVRGATKLSVGLRLNIPDL